MFDIAFAVGPNGEFGNNGGLPWPRLPHDMEWFKNTCKVYDTIICGRSTYNSLPKSLKDKHQFVVLVQGELPNNSYGVTYVRLDKYCMRPLNELTRPSTNSLFIGGAWLLNNHATLIDEADNIFVTLVSGPSFEADTYLEPELLEELKATRFSTVNVEGRDEGNGYFSKVVRYW